MGFYDDIFDWEEIKLFDRAYAIANDAHAGQCRDEGVPYITHIDGVLDVLKTELDVKSDMVLAVAAMHDVLEESDKYTFCDLKKYFGEDVAKDVQLLTKREGQSVQDYLKAISDSDSASWLMLIKLADRLNNIRSLAYIEDPEKKARKCKETRLYYMDYAKMYSQYLYVELNKAIDNIDNAE